MNDSRENPSCYFHPKEGIVGVCPFCLNERLLILASKQGHHPSTHRRSPSAFHRKSPINLPKIFALGSFLNRHRKSDEFDNDDDDDSLGLEDSFISIKFEENGVASWEKNTVSKVSLHNCNKKPWDLTEDTNNTKGTKSVIEHARPRASLRWRKRIGHLFHLIRWKRSGKANASHVNSKVEGVKVRKGWIRTLTKMRAKD
ncbi:Protein OCTOPUS-like [Dillenia turbinata]|uniref:Protein OCTOPUS-like n=1 Tax=Dillenia turbinata TaxID=194707 RepID=A0AAN8W3J1_9MAGN